jgi:hypothetical protein
MSDQNELVLRRALDEIDRNRKWQIVAIIVVLAVFLVKALGFVQWFYRFGSTMSPATRELEVMLITNLQFMVFTVLFCTLGVCVYVSRMAKKTIQAIQLLSKSQGPPQR